MSEVYEIDGQAVCECLLATFREAGFMPELENIDYENISNDEAEVELQFKNDEMNTFISVDPCAQGITMISDIINALI